MKDLIANLGAHLRDAVSIIKASDFTSPQVRVENVVITGLGGSGIGGSIAAEMAAPIANVSIMVNKGYHLPRFVNEKTLVIACSYSGCTEETLQATRIALDKRAIVCCITSGGELQELAGKHNLNILTMEGGNPPRSMLGYSLSFLLHILKFYNVANFDVTPNLQKAAKLLESEQKTIQKEAQSIASDLKDRIPAIYAIQGHLGVASRWRQQLNENAKMLAWEGQIPEMNHNELVGWEGGDSCMAAVFLRNKNDFDRNQKRLEIIKNIIGSKTDKVLEVWSQGQSPIEKILYLIHLGDWTSYYLAEMKGVDILDIKSIDHLKNELGKIPM